MPSLLETVTSLLRQGDNLEKLGALLGIDADRAAELVDLATPVVITGLADRAFEPGGSDIVVRLLDGVDPSIVDNPLVFVERGDASIGEGLLLSIFAGEQAALTATLAERGKVPEPVIARLLPGILALVIGVLGRRRAVKEVDEAGVLTLLAAEKLGLPADRSPAAGAVDGADRDHIPAMAGAATPVDGAALASGPTETVRAAPGSADRGNNTDGGANSSPSASLDIDGEPPDSGDRSEPTERATADDEPPPPPTDRDGGGLLVLVVGGLTAIVLLSWALSQLGGGPATTEAGSGDDTELADEPVGGTSEESTVDADGETAADDDQQVETDTGTETDSDTDSETDTDTTNESSTDDEVVEPATINEELSLDPITFEVRSATITPEGLAVLDEAAEYLKADPELTIEIAGHTDSDGDAADNMRLSQARADVVKAYLESLGIDGARMTPIGYGENDPVASNDTDAGKAQNRRIEFIIQ